MLILTIRTDKPEAELGLFDGETKLGYIVWQAHRQLAETIHQKIKELLSEQDRKLYDLEGVIVFKGPGSFTGLRIGVSVANALADSLKLPIVAADGNGWIQAGCTRLAKGENDGLVSPDYGAEPHITEAKK